MLKVVYLSRSSTPQNENLSENIQLYQILLN